MNPFQIISWIAVLPIQVIAFTIARIFKLDRFWVEAGILACSISFCIQYAQAIMLSELKWYFLGNAFAHLNLAAKYIAAMIVVASFNQSARLNVRYRFKQLMAFFSRFKGG